MRTRIKICCMTNEADLDAAVSCGVDAIGFILQEKSPRYVGIDVVARLAARVPPFVTVVGLFADATRETVQQACSRIPFDLLQFQGAETDEFCASFGHRYIKALRVRPGMDVRAEVARYPGSAGVQLDAFVEGAYGGTGVTIDWRAIPALPVPLVLAGGLAPDNVGEAIRVVRPWAVDVCSGVEAKPGRKDQGKIEAFVAAVRAADRELK